MQIKKIMENKKLLDTIKEIRNNQYSNKEMLEIVDRSKKEFNKSEFEVIKFFFYDVFYNLNLLENKN